MELQDFRVKTMESGYHRFGAREERHDDLVLAVAMGAWFACKQEPSVGFVQVRL